jgi:hypothetical protein
VLSKIFNAVVKWIDQTHCHRLRQLNTIAHKYPAFNAAITGKIRELLPNIDATGGLPDDAVNCALFGDGSRFEVRRKD